MIRALSHFSALYNHEHGHKKQNKKDDSPLSVRLLNTLDDTNSNGLPHVSDSETTEPKLGQPVFSPIYLLTGGNRRRSRHKEASGRRA